MIYNIAIIGAGQLGSRHLQGLALINVPVNIEVLDLSDESLIIAKKRYDQIQTNHNIESITFINSIEKLTQHLDLVIVATNADVRYNIVKNLLNKKNVKALVLEKIVFQKLQHFDEIINLLEEKRIKCWVNCPRRMFPFYKDLKNKLQNETAISITVHGGDWGLACNSIHFLDLLTFLSNSSALEISTEFLDQEIHSSKRNGFIEVSGLLIGKIGINKITLFSGQLTENIILTIKSDSYILIIDEVMGEIKISKKENNWSCETQNEKIVYFQSELSHLFAKDILVNGVCDLTTLKESFDIHKALLSGLTTFINNINHTNIKSCPIT